MLDAPSKEAPVIPPHTGMNINTIKFTVVLLKFEIEAIENCAV
jgi:hypothetical protein